ncbi:hypothetical protein IFR04_006233 [Cadophora malorum]|uniref:Uncharacterized protein n=1 Tax=Cadophora malorum TaxID=108018 RepID=A0A8H7WAW4_9HELO|nr:hypothetical protein IFR04_006233 [Cadophora malorum]|tara:strand:+ start:468 stop:800 length:333 start_codon:yes stop_codon:yes gene_type:complete
MERVEPRSVKEEGGTFEVGFYDTMIELVYVFIVIEGKQGNHGEKKWAKRSGWRNRLAEQKKVKDRREEVETVKSRRNCRQEAFNNKDGSNSTVETVQAARARRNEGSDSM